MMFDASEVMFDVSEAGSNDSNLTSKASKLILEAAAVFTVLPARSRFNHEKSGDAGASPLFESDDLPELVVEQDDAADDDQA